MLFTTMKRLGLRGCSSFQRSSTGPPPQNVLLTSLRSCSSLSSCSGQDSERRKTLFSMTQPWTAAIVSRIPESLSWAKLSRIVT